jgi:hypothetical protein
VLTSRAGRRRVRLLSAALLLCLTIVVGVQWAPQAASADPVGCVPGEAVCDTTIIEDPTDPAVDPGTGLTPQVGPCLDKQTDGSYAELPCSLPDLGWWSNGYQCYFSVNETQDPGPPTLNPIGVWYHCQPPPEPECDPSTQLCRDRFTVILWLTDPPPGVPTLSPGQAARTLVESFALEGITVGLAPDPNTAGSKSYVGVPIWMWAENPTPLSYGPYVQTSTLGAVSITATAEVTSVIWNMGDGSTVTCAAGTPFNAAYGAVDSPTCGHRYARTSASQPGGTFPITATSQWRISWEGAGDSGVINRTSTSTSAVQINEIQSVNVRPGA